MNNTSTAKIPFLTITLIWGIITQSLKWGAVIDWPWQAIWAPSLFALALFLVLWGITWSTTSARAWEDKTTKAVQIGFGTFIALVGIIGGVSLFFICGF